MRKEMNNSRAVQSTYARRRYPCATCSWSLYEALTPPDALFFAKWGLASPAIALRTGRLPDARLLTARTCYRCLSITGTTRR